MTVYDNADCPVCRPEIDHDRRYAAARGLASRWTVVAADPGPLARRGIDPEAQRRRLHALTPDGELAAGIDAVALLGRRMPRYRWLARCRLDGCARVRVSRMIEDLPLRFIAWAAGGGTGIGAPTCLTKTRFDRHLNMPAG